MRTLQWSVSDETLRDEITAFMCNNTQATHPLKDKRKRILRDRYGRPMVQRLHVPNHGKFVQVQFGTANGNMKKNFVIRR